MNLCLGLFLASGAVSLVDDSLVMLLGLHLFTTISAVLSFFAILTAAVVYVLMGLTPMIPKRVFLPVTLFFVASLLSVFPLLIYVDDRVHRALELDWTISLFQVFAGLAMFRWLWSGFRFRWPILDSKSLGDKPFSWRNLFAFLLLNVLVLLPAVLAYAAFCAALAVDHFTAGFMALRPGGLTVQVRKYVRNDGKTVVLVPMSHIGDSSFYRELSDAFPTNAVVLMEGVTDHRNLLTNGISYKRAAHSLGLVEQAKAFKPRGRLVIADVDVDQFTTNTIELLNLVMLIHARGIDAGTVMKLAQYSPPPNFEEQLLDDLVERRNQHLLAELQARLPEANDFIVPWGAGHMPEIAREIAAAGFHLKETQEYTVVRFSHTRN